jgi:hypothetical protein
MTGAMSEEFVQVASDVLLRGDTDPLLSLEWDPRPDASLSSWLDATLSLARAQGRTLRASSALGIACAHLLYPELLPGDLSVSAAMETRLENGQLALIGPAGTDKAERILVEVPGMGLGLVESRWLSALEEGPGPFDPMLAVRRVSPVTAIEAIPVSDHHDERRAAARNLTRLFMSTELLGACEHMMATAVSYAHDRVQFGQPIGTFQAVQHMLAGAEVQIRALRASIELLVPRLYQLGDPATGRHLELLKALAGRTGHLVSQATLQVLGGIGFTEEHEHHRYAKRVLTLDGLCGSTEQLAREIGQSAMRGETQLVAVP